MISVCIATYNGQDYIKEQLDSILFQLDKNDEIIISDDGSTDNTLNIIRSYNDERIIIRHHKTAKKSVSKPINLATKNFENALKNTSGDIIFLCDQDDVWQSSKISDCMKILNDKNCILLVHDATIVDNQLEVIENSYFDLVSSRKGFLKNITKNTYLGCTMCFKKELLNFALPFPQTLHAHDMWLGLLAEKVGIVEFVQKKLILYRRHSSNVTYSGGRSSNSLSFKIRYRINFSIIFWKRLFQIKFNKVFNL